MKTVIYLRFAARLVDVYRVLSVLKDRSKLKIIVSMISSVYQDAALVTFVLM